MAQISESHATLRLTGDDLIPEEVTRQLSCEPTKAHFKGQEIVARKTGRKRVASFGSWQLNTEVRAPEDLDGQIAELLDKLTSDIAIWHNLSSQFDIDLFVGLMLEQSNEGCLLSSASMLRLGERGIALGLDVYANTDD